MTIGEVARSSGLRASAIRYYERAGLLPKPMRTSGQRRYDPAILDRIAVLKRAKTCGFTLTEIGTLLNDHGRYSIEWRRLAEKKIAELDTALRQIAAMKDLLGQSCRCATPDECGQRIRHQTTTAAVP